MRPGPASGPPCGARSSPATRSGRRPSPNRCSGRFPRAPCAWPCSADPPCRPRRTGWRRTSGPFFARDGSDLLVVVEDGGGAHPAIVELCGRFELRAGVSAPRSSADLAGALAQALTARDRTSAERPLASFDDVSSGGMLALLDTPDARVVAAAALAPLVAADPTLPRILRVWLDRDGVYDVAARELGMHRHTLRARVAEAERLLGRDLGGFVARADLYAALRVAG